MNEKQQRVSQKVDRLTQRLERKLPDPNLSPEANRAATECLMSLASRLAELAPDLSLSSMERAQRLFNFAVVEQERPLTSDAS